MPFVFGSAGSDTDYIISSFKGIKTIERRIPRRNRPQFKPDHYDYQYEFVSPITNWFAASIKDKGATLVFYDKKDTDYLWFYQNSFAPRLLVKKNSQKITPSKQKSYSFAVGFG